MQAEMERLQAEEDEKLKRQAALYQAWEDWELAQQMQGGDGEHRPKIRKRCVLEIEVASSSAEGRRTQVVTVPENGSLTIKLRAAMVDEVAESEIETVVLDPQPGDPRKGLESLSFHEFQTQYQRWTLGAMASAEVVRRFGDEVLEMMEAQYAACCECDDELGQGRGEEEFGTRVEPEASQGPHGSPLGQTQMDGDTDRGADASGGLTTGNAEGEEASRPAVTPVTRDGDVTNDVGFEGESGFKDDSG